MLSAHQWRWTDDEPRDGDHHYRNEHDDQSGTDDEHADDHLADGVIAVALPLTDVDRHSDGDEHGHPDGHCHGDDNDAGSA